VEIPAYDYDLYDPAEPPAPPLPPPTPKPRALDPAEAWRCRDAVGPDGTVELPTIAAAGELVDHQARAELPTRATENPPPATADGPGRGHFQGEFARGAAHGRSKLTQANINEARELRAAGWSTGKLAERFGVTRNTICYALLGKTWKDARPPYAELDHDVDGSRWAS